MVELDPLFFVILGIGVIVGVPFVIFCISVIRRLYELHNENQKIEGGLFISDSGEMFSEFDIPIEEILKRKTILLKVIPINPNLKEEKEYAHISTETYKA